MALIAASLTGATTQVLIPDCHGLNTACITRCESSCHLHNLFTTELNIAPLRDGKCIQLGDLGDLTKAANSGCNLSRGLIERLSEDAEFQAFLRKCTGEPTIDAYAIEPAEIQALNLTFRSMATKQVNPLHAPALFDPHFHTLAIVNCAIEHTVQVGLMAYEGDPVAKYIRNRPPVSEVASEASFAAARDWLSTCRREHHKCPMESGVLPSRVLDVGTKLGNEKVRLRATAGKEGQYAALSYCWGSTEFVTLSKSNISSFKAGIDINTLPETIHDAIQVARSWVDSLCIIQDSLEDKAEEISKMSEIYQNATITLSAASSKDSFQGILSKREDVESAIRQFHTLEFTLAGEPKSKGLGTVLLSLDPYCGYITRNFTDSPISQRAWTLQESLLSPRLLVFDTGPLQWKCLQRSSIYGLDSLSKNNLMSRALADPLLDSDLRHKFLAIRHPEGSYVRKDAQSVCAWLEIVTTYTSRAMTNAEDGLLALSGIAAQWKQITGWTYISGIWVEIFPNCLQWRYDFSRDAAGSNSISRPGRYRAPSWSWASINGPVWYGYPDIYPFVQYPHCAQTHVVVERLGNPFNYGWYKETGRVEEELRLCWVDVTAPVREMALIEVVVRFKIMADGHSDYPSFFSDHIILDYNIQHPRNVPQIVLDLMTYDELYQYVQASLPTDGVGDFWRHHMEIESNHSTEHVYFLELSRARGPEGIILAAHILEGLNVFERIGYFRMGRVALGENIDLDRGQCCPEGERDWDWDGGLERNTVRLI